MFADNPIVAREWKRLTRRGFGVLLLLVVAWAGLTWMFRFQVARLGSLPTLTAGLLLVFGALPIIVRPEVFLAPLLMSWCLPSGSWKIEREEFAQTTLSPAQILIGKLAIPCGLLMLLNALAAPFAYDEIMRTMNSSGGRGMVSWWSSLLVVDCALAEDFTFACLCAAYALEELLGSRPRGDAVARAMIRIVAVGAVVAIWSNGWSLAASNIVVAAPLQVSRVLDATHLMELCILAPVPVFEAILVARSVKRSRRVLAQAE